MVAQTERATPLPYREDHVALTKWPVALAIGLSVLTLAFVPLLIQPRKDAIPTLILLPPIFFFFGAAIAWVLVYTGWVLSLEVTPDIIRYGALRQADRRTRRGRGTYGAKPYATWLYEYRCPIPAVKRIWLIGAADALNPERAHPELFGGSQAVAKEGWIRTPFVRGGLMFQFDAMQALMPRFGQSWEMLHPVPAGEALRPTNVWYTPVANPERCRAALVEALQLNGFEVDAEGVVHDIPGAPRREGAVYTKSPPARDPGPRHGGLSIALSIVWALLPLLTLGNLTFAVYGYAALRVREVHTTLIAAAWLVAETAYWWVTALASSDSQSYGAVYAGLMLLMAIGGSFFAFMMRKDVFYYH